MLLAALAVLPALAEEALFRGFITAGFSRFPRWVALLAPSLMFGIFHLEVTQAAGTFVLGLGFGWLRCQTRALTLSVIVHAVHNALVLCVVRLVGVEQATAEPSHEETLLSLALGITLVLTGAALVRRATGEKP